MHQRAGHTFHCKKSKLDSFRISVRTSGSILSTLSYCRPIISWSRNEQYLANMSTALHYSVSLRNFRQGKGLVNNGLHLASCNGWPDMLLHLPHYLGFILNASVPQASSWRKKKEKIVTLMIWSLTADNFQTGYLRSVNHSELSFCNPDMHNIAWNVQITKGNRCHIIL